MVNQVQPKEKGSYTVTETDDWGRGEVVCTAVPWGKNDSKITLTSSSRNSAFSEAEKLDLEILMKDKIAEYVNKHTTPTLGTQSASKAKQDQ